MNDDILISKSAELLSISKEVGLMSYAEIKTTLSEIKKDFNLRYLIKGSRVVLVRLLIDTIKGLFKNASMGTMDKIYDQCIKSVLHPCCPKILVKFNLDSADFASKHYGYVKIYNIYLDLTYLRT